MQSFTSFVVVLLLTGSVSTASGSAAAHRHLARYRDNIGDADSVSGRQLVATVSHCREPSVEDEAPLFSLLPNSNATRSTAPASPQWEGFCGDQSRTRCVTFYASAAVALLLLLCALCVWWLVRYWRRSARHGLHRWNRVDNDSDEVYAEVDVVESENLLGADAAPQESESDGDAGNEHVPRQTDHNAEGRMARCLNRLNLHGTRLWTVLRMSPAGLLYGSSQSSSSVSQPSLPPTATRHSVSASPSEVAVPSRDGTATTTSSSRHVRGGRRDTPPAPAPDARSYLHGVVSVATTTTDSSERGSDGGPHSDDSDAPHDAQHVLCESECLHVDVAEGECPVRRSATTPIVTPKSPLTPHILPQLMDYSPGSSPAVHGADSGDFADNTDSDSQQTRQPGVKTVHTSTSSLTTSANSSAHTPSFVSREKAAAQVHLANADKSILHLDSGERHGDSTPARVGFPHVKTAIFDSTFNASTAAPSSGPPVDPSLVIDLFEPGHFPPPPSSLSAHHAGDAPTSSAASHLSALEYYIPPPATSGTATPTSAHRSGSSLSLPLPNATSAALPVSNSLNDGLDMQGEEIVEELDSTVRSRSYVPATQKQNCQQPQPVLPPSPSPPKPPQESAKTRRKRSISQYSEPWQPISVSLPGAQQLTAAASLTALPVVVPALGVAAPAAAQRGSPRVPLPELTGALEDELDDLMLGDDESAQSNQTGESGHIFSGSSTSTSRTVTPVVENEIEMPVGTPTVFCAAAMANGRNNNSNSAVTDFLVVSPPASASIPLPRELASVVIYARTAGVGGEALLARCDTGAAGLTPPWSSCSVGRRPLKLSAEERTLLMKSRKWLFPLIDGVDEIEYGVVGEGQSAHKEEDEKEEEEEVAEDAVNS
jgi:hypothetical protein